MEWLTFDLHPEYPPEGISRELLRRRYGQERADSVFAMIEAEGLPVDRGLERVPNARKSLVLAELARDGGRLDDYVDRTFRAYWGEGADIGDDDTLLELAQHAGLDEQEAKAEITAMQRLDRVHASTAEAMEAGVGGVPAWVIDRRVLIPGAQPPEVFDRVLGKLGHEPV